MFVARNLSLTIDASGYASDGSYVVSCGDATNLHSRLRSVTRTANTCEFTITPQRAAMVGDATFTIPYSSTGGATLNAVVTVEVGVDSRLSIADRTARTIFIKHRRAVYFDFLRIVSDGDHAVTCSSPSPVLANPFDEPPTSRAQVRSFERVSNCLYKLDVALFFTPGDQIRDVLNLTVMLTSSGGATGTATAIFARDNTLDPVLTTSSPPTLEINQGQEVSFNARPYASSGQAFFCLLPENPTGGITVERTGDCIYTITAGQTIGQNSFDVKYGSVVGGERQGQDLTATLTIPVQIFSANHIFFTPPTPNPQVVASGENMIG